MTLTALLVLVLASLLAVADWVAVARERLPLDRFLKPAVICALVVLVWSFDDVDGAWRALFSVALALSLLRDVLAPRWFPGAVAAALLAHGVYVVGFQRMGWSWLWAAAGIVVVLFAAGAYAVRLVTGARESAPTYIGMVLVYIGVVSLMVVAAAATGRPTAVAGAFLFYVSDTLVGWNRFRTPTPYAPLLIVVAYHLAQILLVVSLATGAAPGL
ncbi:lysoplasmalogenase family protein [Embleya sp. NBC_00896]|uniref:lysoplasmalogenase family protein n=1 Tax=Embleya sp. NBC_00896 TaxID=2975961 RepID=UPI00386734DF|nr:lysoplasmalogenase [Embleya sp. NBC_00896]